MFHSMDKPSSANEKKINYSNQFSMLLKIISWINP